jgi:DNA-binding XRE family transcriptional regulator
MKRIMGEKISKLREARQMTQQNLAQILGVSLSTIFKWEKGTASPNSELLPALARLFEVRIDDLYLIDEKEDLLRLITRHAFHLEPDKFYEILYQAENYLTRNGADPEIEFRVWQMKNIQLINDARKLVDEAKQFQQKYQGNQPHLNQQMGLMSLQDLIFSHGIGKIIDLCLEEIQTSPLFINYLRLIAIYLLADRPKEALNWYEKAKIHYPQENLEYYHIDCLSSLGHLERAENIAKRVFELYKTEGSTMAPYDLIRTYNKFFTILEKQKKYKELLKLLEDGLQFLPQIYAADGRDGSQLPLLQESRKNRILALIAAEKHKNSAS